jgi:hypothetical protein
VAGGGYECSSKAAGLSSVYNFLGGWAEVYILQNKMAMHMLCSSMKVGPSTHAYIYISYLVSLMFSVK